MRLKKNPTQWKWKMNRERNRWGSAREGMKGRVCVLGLLISVCVMF